jgi:hypothetical protein
MMGLWAVVLIPPYYFVNKPNIHYLNCEYICTYTKIFITAIKVCVSVWIWQELHNKKRYRNWYDYTSYPMCTKKWKDICIMNSYGGNDNDKQKGIYVKNS